MDITMGIVHTAGSDARLDKLEVLVDEYVESVRETGREPKDSTQYIFEATVELFYGPGIWEEINKLI